MGATALLNVIKEAAVAAQDANVQTALCYGRVTSANPLKIMVDNKFELSSEFLIVPKHLTNRTVKMKFNAETEATEGGVDVGEFDSHSHAFIGVKDVEIQEGLKSGESVMLLRMQGGQSYFVVGRL